MFIKMPKDVVLTVNIGADGVTRLNLADNLAREIYNEVDKNFFMQDFENFLEAQHPEFDLCESNSIPTWETLWEVYQQREDMNVAKWDTFKDVLQKVYEQFGKFECHVCGKKLLSEFPAVDHADNCYCDKCDEEYTDFCEECGERHLKSELTYTGDGVGYCDNCKELYVND